jgi:hypothetical protein
MEVTFKLARRDRSTSLGMTEMIGLKLVASIAEIIIVFLILILLLYDSAKRPIPSLVNRNTRHSSNGTALIFL